MDSNLVRFRDGMPERWAGWVRYLSSTTLVGVCRSLNRWSTLNSFVWTGIGTNMRFYVASDDLIYDVTPIRASVTLADPLATTISTSRIVVADVAHGAWPGDQIIISGAADTGGIVAARLNTSHIVTEYIDDDHYAIDVGLPAATSTVAAGGGATVTIQYVFTAGGTSQSFGGGWGSGAWGEEEWGGTVIGGYDKMGAWSQDNWGEDLVACAFDGPIFYWDATNPTNRMIDIRDLPGADGNAPEYARFIAVSHRDRHLLAFGPSNEFGGTTYAPMTVRWCSQEDIFNWDESDLEGSAGSIPLSRGSRFIAVESTQREFLVWSDTTLYSLQFVGAPDVYVADILSDSADIAGMNAAQTFGTTTFWMGRSGFYVYDGRVTKMPCPVWNAVSSNLNLQQLNKVYAGTNRSRDEVIWFYPSAASDENDSYVAYDIVNDAWTVGTLCRTAWIDMDFQYPPLAADATGKLYYHETGSEDGSQDPPVPLDAFLESAPFELSSEGSYDKGDRFIFLRRILPDVYFTTQNSLPAPEMRIVIKMMDKPGGGFTSSGSGNVTGNTTLTVQEFTEEIDLRLRGRSMTIRLESDTPNSMWRMGVCRFDIRTDGQR